MQNKTQLHAKCRAFLHDMAELIVEVRYFLAKGRLDQRLALDFLHQAYSANIAQVSNWKAFSHSYFVGLAMTNGNTKRFQEALNNSLNLQKNKQSLWNLVALLEDV